MRTFLLRNESCTENGDWTVFVTADRVRGDRGGPGVPRLPGAGRRICTFRLVCDAILIFCGFAAVLKVLRTGCDTGLCDVFVIL